MLIREAGRILRPAKSPETLPPTKGERKSVARDGLTEDGRGGGGAAVDRVVFSLMRVVGSRSEAMVAVGKGEGERITISAQVKTLALGNSKSSNRALCYCHVDQAHLFPSFFFFINFFF